MSKRGDAPSMDNGLKAMFKSDAHKTGGMLPSPSINLTEFSPRSGISPHGLRSWMLVTPVDVIMIMLPVMWAPQHLRAFGCLAILNLLFLTNGRRYRTRVHISVLDELPFLVTRLLTATALVATVTALRHEQESVTSFLVAAMWALALFVLGRAMTMQIVLLGRRRRIVAHRTLLVGGGALSAELAAILERYPQYGLVVEGFVDDTPVRYPVDGVPWLGPVQDVDAIVRNHRIDTLLVSGKAGDNVQLIDMLRRRPANSYDLLVVPRLYQFHTQNGLPDHIGAIPVMHINKPSLRGIAWAAKRGFDVVASAIALLLLAPVYALCALAVRIEGGPGVLFRQRRVGYDGRNFECLKFRSIRQVDPGESATRWSIANDPRVGKVGRILRRSSLDELPQLWNILRGDMTLVGPRPERPYFVDKFSAEVPHYDCRHRVRGGLTGLAQVSGLRGDTPITDRARFDNYYIENWSLWMDAKIILRTFREVLSARGR
jgi:exopolysaccharide biosynthesis polyprenyl glycosylphosphotransferase